MSRLPDVLTQDGLTVTIATEGETVTVVWQGICDSREPDAIVDALMRRLNADHRIRPVTIDFRGLEFMNSVAVSPIIRFIKQLDALTVRTRLVYDTQVDWQRVHYQCMRTIARALTHIDVEGR